ncbi:MAG: ATP-dependent RNA helicase HrpA [Thermodesulfobacteriota bacterium]
MSLQEKIDRLRSGLAETMLRDRHALARRLDDIRRKQVRHGTRESLRRLAELERRLLASIEERGKRLASLPSVTYPEHLPIVARREEIVKAIREHQVLIVSGETGCGKSTQLPKMCVEAGRGVAGKIGCTQPRRIAATTIARRIAQELGEAPGRSVGYKIRFTDRTSREGYIKIMTDGMLLAETQGDRRLLEYDTLIIDEAHERNLNIDFLLGILRTLLPSRPDLHIIISSATLDTEKFSLAFQNAPLVQVKGRVYPVEVEYMPLDEKQEEAGDVTYVDMAVRAVDLLRAGRRPGDVLVFMPTEQDILETCERLEGRGYPGVAVLPLFARLPGSEQGRVYAVTGPKIVVATNVAETSLTIPGIRYVIDTGLARLSTYQPRTRTKGLPIRPVSRASADQRKGRCGRVQHGVCIRLYSEEDYLSRPAFTPPEILRSNLAEVILRMHDLGLGRPDSFPFLDKPGERNIKDGFDVLLELGAIVREGKEYKLTEMGKDMARMPLDPRISRMMIEARREGCPGEVAVIASALSIQDPRERPVEKADQADRMHAPFRDPASDFITLLNIWNRYHREWEALKTQNKMRRFCKEHFLSFSRMREWVYTHGQISTILGAQKQGREPEPRAPESVYDAVHRSILSGFLSNIAVKKDKNLYQAARGKEVMLFPGSTLFNRNAPWIVAAEMVKTTRLFARTAARIDPEWLEALGGDLCKRTHSDPHWERDRGEVQAYEQVSLYGLPIVIRRPVPYSKIHPEEAHRIFVQAALVEGDVRETLPFLTHNRSLLRSLSSMEDKLRRRDILLNEAALAELYSSRLPGISDLPSLKRWIREAGGDRPLRFREEDLLLLRPDEAELGSFPDRMTLGERQFECTYRFAPGKAEDGVTVRVPAGLLSRLPFEGLDWGVPGLLREKVTALIRGLPKAHRKRLVPVSRTVDVILEEMTERTRPLLTTLADFLYRRFGVDIPASVWSGVEIPEHLRVRVSLTDSRGREVNAGRDVAALLAAEQSASLDVTSDIWNKARKKWERTGLESWDFGDLPASIFLREHLPAYPGLEPADKGVSLRLFPTHWQAMDSHLKGVELLSSLVLAKDLKHLKRAIALPADGLAGARYFGGAPVVERTLYEALLKRLFRRNIRTREAFLALMEAGRAEMIPRMMEIRDQTVRILEAYDRARRTLHALEQGNRSNGAVQSLCGQIRGELDALVPRDFLLVYEPERLGQIPRYVRALQVRAERGAHDPQKDRIKAAQAEEAVQGLRKMTDGLSPVVSEEKREAVEGYRWMVEEFKVSLFAQELKTPFPVSLKRLDERRREIERMV